MSKMKHEKKKLQ